MRVHLALSTALSLPLLLACPSYAQQADPRVSAADGAYDAKSYSESIPLYRSIVTSSLPDDVRARAQWRIGYAAYLSGDKASARNEWLEVADRFPNESRYACEALLRAGNLASAALDVNGAIRAYSRAAADRYALVPSAASFSCEANCWLGNAYVRRAEQARVDAARKVVGAHGIPRSSDCWAAAADDFKSGREAYERVATLFPVSDLASEARMQILAIDYVAALNDRGSFLAVISAADAFRQEFPTARKQLAVVHQVRAESLYALSRYDEALEDLVVVQDQYGDVARAALGTSQYFLARCYQRMGEYERAITEFTKYLDEGKPAFYAVDERAAARYAIATILRLRGRTVESISAFNQVIDENPGTPWERDAVSALEAITTEGNR